MIYTDIKKVIDTLNIENLSAERQSLLQPLIDFIQQKKNDQQDIRLNFICTHNSRRSHLSQIWAQVMASYNNIKNVFCYSGGTEATAMFPMVAETLIHTGFKINKLSEGKTLFMLLNILNTTIRSFVFQKPIMIPLIRHLNLQLL